jgi:hypothetical protein
MPVLLRDGEIAESNAKRQTMASRRRAKQARKKAAREAYR